MSTEKKVAKGNVQTSVIIPLEFQWNNETLSDLYDTVYNQLKLMGWQIPGSDRKEDSDSIKNKQNDNDKQRKYLTTSSQYILHGMSATFQNVWTDFKNQRFTVRIFDSLKYKEKHSSQSYFYKHSESTSFDEHQARLLTFKLETQCTIDSAAVKMVDMNGVQVSFQENYK